MTATTDSQRFQGRIYCPKDAGLVPVGKGEFLWQAMAFPHLKDKTCKLCGKPSADHIVVVEKEQGKRGRIK